MILPDDRFSDSKLHRFCTCSIRTDFLYNMWRGRGMMACGREMVLFRNFRCLNDFRLGRQNGKDGTVQSIPLGRQCQAGLSLVSGADPPPSPRCKTVSAFLGSDVGKTGHERTPDNGSTFTARASTSICIQHSHHFCHCWHGCNCSFGFLQILLTRGISFDIGARLM